MSVSTAAKQKTATRKSPSTAVRHRKAPERRTVFLLVPVVILIVVGLGAVWSASSVVAIREGINQHAIFQRQLLFVGLGIVALIITSRIPYRIYQRFAMPILILSLLGLVATDLFGSIRGGAQRWIEVGPITVQTSEFSKFAVVAYLAAALSRKEKYLHSFSHLIVPVSVSVGLSGALLLRQPDFGTTILISGAAFAVLVSSAARFSHVALLGAAAFGSGAVLAVIEPYRLARIRDYFAPTADPLGDSLQTVQAQIALGTGGLFGLGPGASRARWSFLPNAHTDFIFAIIGEEQGFAGALGVMLLFVLFAVVGSAVALKSSDQFGRLLAVGIVTWISLQAIVNIGGVVGALPISGVPLPFVSAGGSAMVVNLAVVGVLVNIARSGLGSVRKPQR